MDAIDRLKNYPLERIAATKQRLKAYWDGGDIGRPVVFTTREQPQYWQQFDLEIMMVNALECMTGEAFQPGDNVPGFFSDLGPVALASAFGEKLRFEENGPPWIDPVIHTADEVRQLVKPAVTDGLVGECIRRARVFLHRCEGKIHVRPMDMQGPLNTASLVWEQQDFLMSMRTHPEAVHHVVNLVTDYIIDVFRALMAEFPEQLIFPNWPTVWLPTDYGVGFTEDLLPLISAKSYREFGLPYTQRIAETFGGLTVHCCGDCERHLPALAEIPNLRLFDFSYSHCRPEAVQEILGDGKRAFLMSLSERGKALFLEKHSFLKRQIEFYERGMRLMFSFSGDEPELMREQLQILGVDHAWDE